MTSRIPIYVVGYPRSGNTWVSRLLGDVLNSPVEGFLSAKPIATEGQERDGMFVVRQLHLRPVYHDIEGGLTANEICVPKMGSQKIVLVIRDPRDVAVSVMYYWNLPDIKTAITVMGEGVHPLKGIGAWTNFVQEWEDASKYMLVPTTTFYENLIWHGSMELSNILHGIGVVNIDEEDMELSISRQEINKKREQVSKDGDKRPYGKEIQVKALRKGVVGDWKQHFSKQDCELAHKYFGEKMLKMGYIQNSEWFLDEV